MDHRVAALAPGAADRRENAGLGRDQHLLLLRRQLDRCRVGALEAQRGEDLAAGAEVGMAAMRALGRAVEGERQPGKGGRCHGLAPAGVPTPPTVRPSCPGRRSMSMVMALPPALADSVNNPDLIRAAILTLCAA